MRPQPFRHTPRDGRMSWAWNTDVKEWTLVLYREGYWWEVDPYEDWQHQRKDAHHVFKYWLPLVPPPPATMP